MNNTISRDYVMGFLFDDNKEVVALIEKQKPDWMRGLWNGIGGKVEGSETAERAMRREFREEAGVDINNWKLFCTITGHNGGGDQTEDWFIHCFKAQSDGVFGVRTVESEIVKIFATDHLPRPLNSKVAWLIALAQSDEIISVHAHN